MPVFIYSTSLMQNVKYICTKNNTLYKTDFSDVFAQCYFICCRFLKLKIMHIIFLKYEIVTYFFLFSFIVIKSINVIVIYII